jgi:hypothetical protein
VSPGEPVPSVELKQKLLYRHEPPDYRVMKSAVSVAPPQVMPALHSAGRDASATGLQWLLEDVDSARDGTPLRYADTCTDATDAR